MANRHQRRAQSAQLARAARLRCVACERVNQPMTKEHLWPLWLIGHAGVHHEGIRWEVAPGRIHPKNATLPLCKECNHRLGSELEEPVSRILPKLEGDYGISDVEAELLVRWLWKFEGLSAGYAHAGDPHWRYSDRWTLIHRILDEPLGQLRGGLTLAVGMTHQNDPGYRDWPMGIDSDITDLDAIFVSGVFGKTALMVSLDLFEELIPGYFGIYRLNDAVAAESVSIFFPPVCFPYSKDAINVTIDASERLKAEHEAYARRGLARAPLVIARPRIEIP